MRYAKHPLHHGNHVGTPAEFKPSRSPAVPVRTVSCPDCHAQEGEGCKSSTGTLLGTAHISRRRMALRKLRGES